jgi:CheY-like chemotaxis protein
MPIYRTVMVIDDSRLERFLAEKIIKNSLFADAVITFNSAIEALEYLTALGTDPDKFPDVILLDIYMPVMNGFEFLDKFLEFSEDIKKHCKIVIISSTDAYEDHAQMRRYPIISKFLTKPLSEEMLKKLGRL